MPPRFDYDPQYRPSSPSPPTPPAPEPIKGVGLWHHGRFELAPGVELPDGQFVCPYGEDGHLVEITPDVYEEDEEAGGFYEGMCEVCQRTVEIDYEPSQILWPRERAPS